ncbi:MAG: polymer-forming cytoskeletal protein [Candidatus Margulisbacteria bacterium]|nr:polymer-forming cytoskeletal protein [Candidatus Margulisiibacteriota bacterium]
MGLFNIEKNIAASGAVDSIIGEKAKLKGELFSRGSISVNGEFEGKLAADGEVLVAAGSMVIGDIYAGSVVVSGKVDGNIAASQTLEITKKGRVNGDLIGGRIVIEEGSFYCGRVKVEGKGSANNDVIEEAVEIVEAQAKQTAKL